MISLLTAAALTPILRVLAVRFGILDQPKHHGIHSQPVPRLGGAGIYIAFVVGALYRMDLSEMLKGVLVGSTIVFVTGLWDDLRRLRASVRLVIQLFACAIMMFKYGVILDVFPYLWLNVFFTTLGIIGLTNAVNFLDNMDGLAAGLVMISSLAIAVVAYNT
ncbi:MAG TPA: MraY family glycosyltransferase, partial [bacterium]|nr:MraY family glycosyltransferase [bacterium]